MRVIFWALNLAHMGFLAFVASTFSMAIIYIICGLISKWFSLNSSVALEIAIMVYGWVVAMIFLAYWNRNRIRSRRS